MKEIILDKEFKFERLKVRIFSNFSELLKDHPNEFKTIKPYIELGLEQPFNVYIINSITKIIREYENQKSTNSSPSIIQTIGAELQKNITMGNCPICGEKLEFNHDNNGFYFACSNKAHEERNRIETDSVLKAVASLRIKCNNCSSGQMVLRYGKEPNPFLGCTEYRKSNCRSKLQLHDKYR